MSTRNRILDAAAAVLTRRGIAGTTTRAIVREADCSEALSATYFGDKQEIFLAVMSERMPTIDPSGRAKSNLEGAEQLANFVQGVALFFFRSFPIASSV
ncbi:TetR/AcrR family transcriptional regulator [Lysinibacter cavernae]|uniref:TetR/AcrR family transcriptional regulator n=1 Tax=Lysinibacter cavernae TaxID=1640652 RepID=UPI00361B25AD